MALPENKSLSLIPTGGSESAWWAMAQQQAAMLVKTGFLPQSIKTPEQALAIMMKGRELGVPPMYALSNIVIIQGKPTCNAELMLALVRRDHGSDAIRIALSTNEKCTVQWRTWGQVSEYSFTIDDAKTAQLVIPNSPWQKYPAAMLRARCISAVCRMAFPESIAGMYTGEELGGPSDIDDDVSFTVLPSNPTSTGEIVDTQAEPTDDDESQYGPGLITRRQMRHIRALQNELQFSNDEIKQMHGKASAKDLTVTEASALIDDLKAQMPPAETIDPDTGEIVEPGLPGLGAANPQQYAK
jgi:hypothetical protein